MIGILLGILGIIITLGFGFYSIWTYKRSKKNVSLEFQNKECYSLFRDDVRRLNIELKYKDIPLPNPIVLLKAKLINNGHIDIDQNRIYSPLKIITSKEFKWLETNITCHPNSVNTSIKLNSETEIQIDWDLLKKSESIEIEALAEFSANEKFDGQKAMDFFNGLSFDFRITDLSEIQKEKVVPAKIKRRRYLARRNRMVSLATIFIGLVFLSPDLLPFLKILESDIVKFKVVEGSNEVVAYIYATNPESIILKMEDQRKLKMSASDFNKQYRIVEIAKIDKNPKSKLANRIFGITYIVLGGFLLLLRFIVNRIKQPITQAKGTSG